MICLLTALHAEASPLIRHFKLSPSGRRDPFPTYFSEGIAERDTDADAVALVISGVGKLRAAAAVGYLHGVLRHGVLQQRDEGADAEHPHDVWLNVGIAGHGSLGLGEVLLAHEIRDASSGVRHFPPLVVESPCRSETVITVDRVERTYQPAVAYDMEASGFCAAAGRLTLSELLHCIKVVSDGPDADVDAINKRQIETWIEGALPIIDSWLQSCQGLVGELAPLDREPADYAQCLAGRHFTLSDRRQLRRLLRRRQTLVPAQPLPLQSLSPKARGRQLNQVLSAWLDGLQVDFMDR